MGHSSISQELRSASKPLQGRKHHRRSSETQLALELVNAEVAVVSFPLQDTKSHQATGHVGLLGALRARLTAGQAKLILTDATHRLKLGPAAIHPASLGSWQPQAMGGVVRLAVSDHQNFQPPTELAALGPVRMAPMVTARLPIEAALLY